MGEAGLSAHGLDRVFLQWVRIPPGVGEQGRRSDASEGQYDADANLAELDWCVELFIVTTLNEAYAWVLVWWCW